MKRIAVNEPFWVYYYVLSTQVAALEKALTRAGYQYKQYDEGEQHKFMINCTLEEGTKLYQTIKIFL